MRLDKFLSHAGGLTRSLSRRAIKGERVQVGGRIVKDPGLLLTDSHEVRLDGDLLTPRRPQYLMLNKPRGYVCATEDSEHPTVMDLLEDTDLHMGSLSIAGRLDKDSTGLVLLSDDGPWIHRVTSPRHPHAKSYLAELAAPIHDDDIRAFAEGIMLRSEKRPTRPAELKELGERRAEVVIGEGRYHQVRRMFAARGNKVESLHRQRIGEIELDPGLQPGDWRPLTLEELTSV